MTKNQQNSGKRICLIRHSVYPYELSFRREVETIYRAGFETHVICLNTNKNDLQAEEIIGGVYVHRMPLTRKKTSIIRYIYDYLSFFLLTAFTVTKLHLQHRFVAIQVNTMPDFLVFATLIPKILGAKIVVMMQEPVPELWQTLHNTQPPRILKLIEQAALAYAHAALTVTQQLKDVYVSRGAKADKISVILNVPETRFLELNEEKEMSQSLSGANNHFSLICHGAIEERYGQDTILEAIHLIRSQIPNLRLRILGRGSYVNQFLEQRSRLELEECVDYLGFVSFSEMIHELQSADIGIVAQKSSPYSNLVHTNKMYEYIAMGKPVLASRLKAVNAYFDDDSLYFFEPGDANSLAQAILDLYQHPAKCQKLVKNSQRLYHQYKWEQQKQIYLAVYDQFLTQ
jgi:glycosyltransferase involved in cell wall biosynthesis